MRSKLEQSAVVWHSSLTQKCKNKLERVQKSALRVILGPRYTDYSDALKQLNLQTLDERRRHLCFKFAKKCLMVEKFKKMFPLNVKSHNMSKRNNERYRVNRSLTERHKLSAIPYMQRLLNEKERNKMNILKQIDSFSMPVTNGTLYAPHH